MLFNRPIGGCPASFQRRSFVKTAGNSTSTATGTMNYRTSNRARASDAV